MFFPHLRYNVQFGSRNAALSDGRSDHGFVSVELGTINVPIYIYICMYYIILLFTYYIFVGSVSVELSTITVPFFIIVIVVAVVVVVVVIFNLIIIVIIIVY
jgi:hypothetical protein